MIELQPHALKRRVLFPALATPAKRLRICLAQPVTNTRVNHRYSAETAMVSISHNQAVLQRRVRSPRLGALVERQFGWRIRHLAKTKDAGVSLAPNRLNPFVNRRYVCGSNERGCARCIAGVMRVCRGLEQCLSLG